MGEMDLACCYNGSCGMANRDLSAFDLLGVVVVPILGLVLLAVLGA